MKLRLFTALLVLCAVHTVSAQDLTLKLTQTGTGPVITGTASVERLRFAAPGTIVQMELRIYGNSGELLFDVTAKGNVLDWALQDGGGKRLAVGSYLCVVTARDISGKLSRRVGSVAVHGEQIELRTVEVAQLTGAQQQAVGPVEENGTLTILKSSEAEPITLVANDGREGQLIRGRGALSFRVGDFFSGTDKEQMRLTEDGRLGIGTDNPQSALDVAGSVRVSEGIKFADGTTLSATEGKLLVRDANGDPPTSNAAGTGTVNQVAKWSETGGAGTLTDSALYESGGNLGLNTSTPEGTFHIQSPDTTVFKVVSSGTQQTARAVFQMYRGASVQASGWDFGYNVDLSSEAFIIRELTNGAPNIRFTLAKNTGNVGIGTTTPTAKLQVAGNVNFTGFRTELTSNTPNVIGGDSTNVVEAGAFGATISGGGAPAGRNRVFDYAGTVGGGNSNTAGNYATVAGGSGNTASGNYSSVPGGVFNTAQGYSSFAAGSNAQALHAGSFVWSDTSAHFLFDFFKSTANNQFLINATGGVGIGTNAPAYRLDVVGRTRIRQNAGQTGSTNTAGLWFFQNTPAVDRAFVGMESDNTVGFFGGDGGGWGLVMNTQTGDVGIGTTVPNFKLQVLDQSNRGLRVQTNTAGGTVASFGGLGDFHIDAAGLAGGRLTVKENGSVGIGTSSPNEKLSVNGNASKPGGGSWNIFSDARLKNIKGRFAPGLNAVMKLQPIRYEYKNDNALNLKSEGEYIGFSAQAVQKVIPEAVTKNAQGYLLVNNDPIMWTMLNAIKEQQTQIEQQREQLKQQQGLIEGLKNLVCRNNPKADVCR